MKQNVKTCVIPFSKLEKTAYEYCKQANHISGETPVKRREKFEKQAANVWENMKEGKVQVALVFAEDGTENENLFPKEWMDDHLRMSEETVRVCLYRVYIPEEPPREEKFSLQFLQDNWCEAVILAAKDNIEQYLKEERWKTESVESVAAGIDGLPLECVFEWTKKCKQAGIEVEISSDGHITPENSLFAAYIEHK